MVPVYRKDLYNLKKIEEKALEVEKEETIRDQNLKSEQSQPKIVRAFALNSQEDRTEQGTGALTRRSIWTDEFMATEFKSGSECETILQGSLG